MPYIFERFEGDEPATLVVLYAALEGEVIVPTVDRMRAWPCPVETRDEADAEIQRLDPAHKWMPFAVGRSTAPKPPTAPPMPGRHHTEAAREDWLARWEREHGQR